MSEYVNYSTNELAEGIDDIPRVRELVRRIAALEGLLEERERVPRGGVQHEIEDLNAELRRAEAALETSQDSAADLARELRQAEAALAAIEAERRADEAANHKLMAALEYQKQRVREERARASDALSSQAKAEAERDALKCCGNCGYWQPEFCDCEDDVDDEIPNDGECDGFNHCHFTPSRWQPREGGEE